MCEDKNEDRMRWTIQGVRVWGRAEKKWGENGVFFFLLLAARVRSSCEEGPGQSALQSA